MKIGVSSWDTMSEFLDLVELSFFVPTHYRTDRGSDPIPAGQWSPDIDDVNAYIVFQAPQRAEQECWIAGEKVDLEMLDKMVLTPGGWVEHDPVDREDAP